MNNTANPVDSIATLKAQGIIRGTVFSYRYLSSARSAAYDHAVKPMWIVMGDCPWFWVVSPADAERLVRAGYEMIG